VENTAIRFVSVFVASAVKKMWRKNVWFLYKCESNVIKKIQHTYFGSMLWGAV